VIRSRGSRSIQCRTMAASRRGSLPGRRASATQTLPWTRWNQRIVTPGEVPRVSASCLAPSVVQYQPAPEQFLGSRGWRLAPPPGIRIMTVALSRFLRESVTQHAKISRPVEPGEHGVPSFCGPGSSARCPASRPYNSGACSARYEHSGRLSSAHRSAAVPGLQQLASRARRPAARGPW
jgi:hypothetical protein